MNFIRKQIQDESGFTLIEMVLVALMILILSTMALASMRRARETAMETGAQKGLKSIAEAEEMFYQDSFVYADDYSLLLQKYLPRTYTAADQTNGFIKGYSVIFQRLGQPILGSTRVAQNSVYPNFTVYALPISERLNLRTFRTTQDGRITVYVPVN